MWGVGVPLPMVAFDLSHAPPTLILAHPNPSTLVNELEDPGVIECSVQLEGNLSVKGWWLCAGGVASPTQEVGHAIVLGDGTDII